MLTSISKILLICILAISTLVFAGSPAIFEGDKTLLLKQNIDLNRQFFILSGNLNPSVTAVAANPGSLYMSSNTNLYKKNDAGLTTNWAPFGVAPTTTAWGTQGNFGTNPATDFVGTADNQDFVLKSNNLERLRLRATGEIDTTLTAGVVHSNAQGILSSGIVNVNEGGTSQSSLTANAVLIGNGVSPVSFVSPNSNGDCLQVVAGVWTSTPCSSSGGASTITGTARFTGVGSLSGPVDLFDGQHTSPATETLVKVGLSMGNTGSKGFTDVFINHTDANGVPVGAGVDVTIVATGARGSVIRTLAQPITYSAGHLGWPDISVTPTGGNPHDLSVDFIFQ